MMHANIMMDKSHRQTPLSIANSLSTFHLFLPCSGNYIRCRNADYSVNMPPVSLENVFLFRMSHVALSCGKAKSRRMFRTLLPFFRAALGSKWQMLMFDAVLREEKHHKSATEETMNRSVTTPRSHRTGRVELQTRLHHVMKSCNLNG